MKRLVFAGIGALAVMTVMGFGERRGHAAPPRHAMPAKAPMYEAAL
jgi:nitrogen regulatory protein PII